jgi:hypothetical protein
MGVYFGRLRSVPDSKRCVAKLCRNTCGVTVSLIPAFAADFLTPFGKNLVLLGTTPNIWAQNWG